MNVPSMNINHIKLVPGAILFALFLMGTHSAYAQSPTLTESTSPGAILQYNTKPWAIPQPQKPETGEPSNRAPSREKSESAPTIEFEKNIPAKPLSSKLLILIKDIRIEGMTRLPENVVEQKLQPYRNRELTFDAIQGLADELTNLYVQAGYINSQVYIPPQDLKDHLLILRVFEVKVGQINLEEGRWFKKNAILPRIDLRPGEVLNVKPLSASIRRINDNPNIQLHARLVKGKALGTTDIVLQAKDQFPLHATPFWDNLGRRNIGNQRFGLTLTHNNLLGFGDINTNSFNLSKSSFVLVNQYALPIGSHGTQVGLDYAYSNVKLGGSLKPLDIHSSAQIFSPVIRQALWRNDRASLNTEIAFDFKNLNTDILSAPFHQDRLRVLRPSLNGYWNDKHGRTYFTQEVGIGLNILGGSTGNTALASKAGSGTRFLRLTGGLTRIQQLPWGTTGVLRSHYQYTHDRLVSAEQMQMGGAFSVRGYQEGRLIGDKGYSVSAEWYMPCFLIPQKIRLPLMHQPLRQAVQMVGFTDVGQVYTNRSVGGETRRATLLASGVGLRIQLTKYWVARIDIGFPLIHQAPYENRPRLHFGLQSNIF